METAPDGKIALEKTARDKPALIILDVTMPQMDGIEACRRLRGSPATKNIPIIFLSAQRGIAELTGDMPGAPIEYIAKPCDVQYLLKRVDELISGSLKKPAGPP